MSKSQVSVAKKASQPKEYSKTEFLGLLDLAKSVIDAKKEYAIVKAQEETKMLAISADLDKCLATLNAKMAILEKHLENEFQLRKGSIGAILLRLDVAIDSNSEVVAAAALSAIHGIVSSNPLSGVGELRKFFEAGDGILEI